MDENGDPLAGFDPGEEQCRAYADAYAKALEGWGGAMEIMMHGEPRPPEVEAVASVLGMDPGELDWHVEAEHGHEPHDEGYEASVWAAAACDDPEHLRDAAKWGRPKSAEGGAPARPPSRQRVMRNQPRRTSRSERRRT